MGRDEKPYSSAGTFRKILGYLPTKRRYQLWILFLSMVCISLLETVTLGAIALFVSAVSDPESVLKSKYILLVRRTCLDGFLDTMPDLIIVLSIILIALVAIKNTLNGLVIYWNTRFSSLIEGFFAQKLLNGFLQLFPYEWHLTHNSADLILAIEWRRYVGSLFILPLLETLLDILMVGFMLGALLYVEPYITLIIIFVLGAIAFTVLTRIRRLLHKVANSSRDYQQSINKQVARDIQGIKDLKVSGREAALLRDFREEVYPLARLTGQRKLLAAAPARLLETIGALLLAGSICLMLLLDSSTAKVTGTMTLLAVTAWRVLPALNRAVSGMTRIQDSLPYVQTILGYLEEMGRTGASAYSSAKERGRRVQFLDKIRLDNVSFAYKGAVSKALEGVTFEVAKGRTYGVIGASGSGKSTLVDIMIGLLVPTEGEMLIDGTIVDGQARRAWMRTVGYVPQSPYIWDGTLAENVALGRRPHEIDREWILACCRMAAMDFLVALPSGLDTLLGERGVRLSGGQRQRVSIARALYNRPELIIFDEATSALDSVTERAIQKTIYSFKGEHTIIIVAHRLTTVEECDLLVWLDKGRLRRIGPPEEILSHYVNA